MKWGYVYLILAIPALRIKIGFATNLKTRIWFIEESLKNQKLFPLFVIVSTDYKKIEKHLHNVFGFCRYKWKGSGRSEWFRIIFLPLIFFYMVIIQLLKIIEFFTYIAAFFFALWVIYEMIIK